MKILPNIAILLAVGILLSLGANCIEEEKDYTDIVRRLKSAIEKKDGGFYHQGFKRLAYLSDTYGSRLWGSAQLEKVIYEVYTMAIL